MLNQNSIKKSTNERKMFFLRDLSLLGGEKFELFVIQVV